MKNQSIVMTSQDNSVCHKRVQINACGEIYDELSKTRPSLYKHAPKKTGIDFVVDYYDSLPSNDQAHNDAPVVCLLHGAPGNYRDFNSMIEYLAKKGVRVIAPNFPDYTATFEHSFRHSPIERCEFLAKFFEKIGIAQVDMMLGHSSAIYTILELVHSYRNRIVVKSLGFLSTPTYDLPANMAVTPFRLFTLKLFDYPILRPIIVSLIQVFVSLQGIRNKIDKNKIEDLLIAASAVGYSGSENAANHLQSIHELKIPTFLLYGCKDKLIPVGCFDRLRRDLKIFNCNGVKCYDDDGKVIQDVDMSNRNDLVEISQFSSGGHYVFQKFSNQANDDIWAFLERKVLRSSPRMVKL